MKNTLVMLICFMLLSVTYAQQSTNFTGETNATQTVQEFANHSDIEKKRTSRLTKSTTVEYSLEYSLEAYKAMISECQQLTDKLLKHRALSDSGLMNKKQMIDWKRDLVAAKLLNYRIDDFKSACKNLNYPIQQYVNSETIDNHQDFSKILVSTTIHLEF